MDYLHFDTDTLCDVIAASSVKLGLPQEIVEKDYYVTMILRLISEKIPQAVFKGGTSLSKCYGIIDRFSEDIDIAVFKKLTQGEKKKIKESIKSISDELCLPISDLDNTRSRRDYNKYTFVYKSVFDTDSAALAPSVIMETAYTTVSFPTVKKSVDNLMRSTLSTEAPELIEKCGLDLFDMTLQSIERTLIDKVFALCDYYMTDNVKRHSRHIYDIHKILPLVERNEAFKALVKQVRDVRKLSPVCPSSQDNVDVNSILRDIVETDAYKFDYNNLTVQLLNEKVQYETAITAIKMIIEEAWL